MEKENAPGREQISYKCIIEKQIALLAEWNTKNIEEEPEQVRMNAETIKALIESSSRFSPEPY